MLEGMVQAEIFLCEGQVLKNGTLVFKFFMISDHYHRGKKLKNGIGICLYAW